MIIFLEKKLNFPLKKNQRYLKSEILNQKNEIISLFLRNPHNRPLFWFRGISSHCRYYK